MVDKENALTIFTILPNITMFEDDDYVKVDKEKDEGYIPTLYYYGNEYVLDWIGEETNTIKSFNAKTPEEVIDKAYSWCINEQLL